MRKLRKSVFNQIRYKLEISVTDSGGKKEIMAHFLTLRKKQNKKTL